ncbi:uncharacterized protein P884DRAFT_193178 [Thermothelomyces heterothallicus CBS 202.75]|uniref:uncharacterized protein n=1 Tax=Thermothelomyces heterothallicus CBS 202.75 TaxID=1149848 RepID=UPI00374366A3
MEQARSLGSQKARSQKLRHAIKIVACGGMIGTAILFPLADVQGLWFRALTPSIFILSALGFHALHLEPFIRYGRFTVPAALAFLLVAVLAAGSAREELIPWLPLFIASSSLTTVAMDDISQRIGLRPASLGRDDVPSWTSTDTWSNYSLRSVSTQQRPQSVLASTLHDPLFFARHGPPSRMSQRTYTNGTDITLSGIAPQLRSHWDAQTLGYFSATAPPNGEHPVGFGPRTASPERRMNSDSDPELDSDADTVESSYPLLTPRRGLIL